MLRKVMFAVCVAALTFSACGRQVTPSPPAVVSGIPSGFMQVKFTTAAVMDFTHVQYVIVFNTTGSGGMPYANAAQTNFQNYSFEIVVGGNGVQSVPAVSQIVRQPQGGTPTFFPVGYTPQQLLYNLNSNGQNTQFTVTFARSLFNGAVPTPTPSPGVNNKIWFANWFTTDTSGNPIDAPGLSGPNDTSFVFPPSGSGLDTTTNFDSQWTFQSGWPQVSPQSAQLAGGEVINNP